MDFKELIFKMVKELTCADKMIEKAIDCDDKEMSKIYHKIASDHYEHFSMFHKLAPAKAKQNLGDKFNATEPVFSILHEIFAKWAKECKEKIDKFVV